MFVFLKIKISMRSACLRRYVQPHVTAANARVMLPGAVQRSYLPTSSGICVRGGGVCRGAEQAGSKATVCLEQSRWTRNEWAERCGLSSMVIVKIRVDFAWGDGKLLEGFEQRNAWVRSEKNLEEKFFFSWHQYFCPLFSGTIEVSFEHDLKRRVWKSFTYFTL